MARREPTYYSLASSRKGSSRSSSRRRRTPYSGSRSSGGSGGPAGSRAGSGRRMSVADWPVMLLTVAVALGMAASWAARWIDPASYGILSVTGLLMPVIFVVNFLCMLYWIIRWRRIVFLPLALFVFGLVHITMFFRPSFTKEYADPSVDRSLVGVVSYNVRGMMPSPSGSGQTRSSMPKVISAVDSLRPDILCIQEFRSTPDYPTARFEEALPAYHYRRVRFTVKDSSDHGWGNAVYSKFPITNSGSIDFEGTHNSILWADIAVRHDTVRVFNAHLQTTAIGASDEKYIVGGDFVGDDTRTSRVGRMVRNLTRGNIVRAGQADTLAASIRRSPYPVIVCGDFNDTPVSYSYRTISRRLDDSFREAGRGYGYTYRGFFNLLRIDYILHSPSVECVEYASPSFDNSDHNPVAVKMRMN